jgi:hypothetical protein
MKDYPKCSVCNGVYVTDAIHIAPGTFRLETCTPIDNLKYLEEMYEKHDKLNKQSQA